MTRRTADNPPARSAVESSSRSTSPRRDRIITVLVAAALVAAVIACYWRVRSFGFLTYDDPRYLEHPHVRAGLTWRGVLWAFTGIHFSNWHPLTTLTYMTERHFWGLNAGPYHLFNVLLHAGNTVLLFVVLMRLTGARWRSAFVAALFGLHPIHVESVAWIAERKDVLSALFWILTMWAYAAYAQRGGAGRYVLTLVLLVAGLMSKPMVVTLPFVMLLMDYWPLQRKLQWKLLWEKVPFFALSLASCVVTLVAQRSGGALVAIEHLPMPHRIVNALISYARYLEKTVWPQYLAALYPLQDRFNAGAVTIAVALLLIITAAMIWRGTRQRYLVTGWLWYLGTLVPVIGIVQVGGQAMADRYTYIPLIGVFIIIAWGVNDLLKGWRHARPAMIVAAAVVLSLLAVRTWYQTGYWSDSQFLFERAVEIAPDSPIAQFNLGNAYYHKQRIADAMACYEKAAKLEPGYAQTLHALGLCHVALKQYPRAIARFGHALELAADYPEPRNALGSVLLLQNRLQDAEFHLREAIRLHDEYGAAHYNLGLALLRQQRRDEAMKHLLRAAELNPDDVGAHFQLGVVSQSSGQFADAIKHYRVALRLDPNSAARNNLAWLLATTPRDSLRDGAEAVRLAEAARSAVGNERADVLDTLAAAYAENGQFDRAVATAERAVELAAQAGQAELETQIRQRLELYRSGKPFRDQ